MAGEASTIRAIVRDLDGQQALVEVEQGGCGRCHEEGGCGGQHLTQMFCGGARSYRVENSVNARIGDHVTVAIAAGSVRRTANLAYGVPLLSMIAGALLGMPMAGDLGAMAGAACGLFLAILYIRRRTRGDAESVANRPYIVSSS